MSLQARRSMDQNIVTLAGLTAAQVTTLTSGGITSSEDLMILENEDIVLLLPGASVLVRRRLSNIAEYLAAGSEIGSTTTIRDTMISVSRPNRRTGPTATPTTDSTARGAPKLCVDGLETFDGTPIKWENWEMNTFATLGQTVYNGLVTNPPTPGDSIGQTRNRELYFMLRKAIQGGSAFHLIDASPVDDGHSAIQALKSWYGSTNRSRTIIEHYRMKLQELQLDDRTTATTFINDFIICSQKLEKRNEGNTAETKRHKFLDKIRDDDYDVVTPQLKGETALTFDQCVSRIRTRKQELESSTNKATKAKSRRTSKKGDEKEKEKSSSDQVPVIPGFIVYKIEQTNVRRDLMKW
jgi:hypothetical protein